VKKQLEKVAIFLFCVMLPACWFGQQKEKSINSNLVIINVLDEDSFKDCHIKGSINVTIDELDKFAVGLDKSKEIVVYCSNYLCSSSEFAAKKLKSLGCEHVYVYEAGLAEWYQKGLPVEGPATASYLTKQTNKAVLQSSELIISTESLAQKMKLT